MLQGITFENKIFFWLLLALPLAILWYVLKHKRQTAELKISSLKGFKTKQSWLPKLKHALFALRLIALALLFFIFELFLKWANERIRSHGRKVVCMLYVRTS